MRIVRGRARAVLAALALGLTAPATTAANGVSTVATLTVREQSLTPEYRAYAQVRPVAVVPLRAIEPGTVTALRVGPGSPVRAGGRLATLSGPEIQAFLVSRQGAVRSAETSLTAATRALEAESRQLADHLSTRQQVAAAQSAVAAAAAALQTARAQLQVAQDLVALRAPSTGTVIAVNAGNGEQVMAGQIVLTLQPSGSLWLEATYYGPDAAAIRAGMQGRFEPASGGEAVPVRVASVFPALTPDGGERVGLIATAAGPANRPVAAPHWLDGEWGTVAVAGPARPMISIPTAALIVDRARWWVLVHTPSGDRPQPVVPGPTRGWDTFIEKGLSPGQQVVIQNAYLEFHRGIAQRYAPPY